MGDELQKLFPEKPKLHWDITPYTTFKLPCQAEVFLTIESRDEWITVMHYLSAHSDIPHLIIGGGSNIALIRETLPGIVILNRYIRKETLHDDVHTVRRLYSSGYPIGQAVKETVAEGLSGFEYHLGLPGTIGGALVMNSKWMKPVSYVSDTLERAILIDREGKTKDVGRDYFEFSYGRSRLQDTKEILLEAVFTLKKEDRQILENRSRDAFAHRKATQPFGVKTAGCFFKNITREEQEKIGAKTQSAGYLIDQCGLKGSVIGGFRISDVHANFIENTGLGTPEDLRTVAEEVKAKVKEKFGVELREEVLTL